MKNRPLYLDFLKKVAFPNNKMAFVAGPRQVGKTSLAQLLLDQRNGGQYYSWDDVVFKRRWIQDPKTLIPDAVGERRLFVFDELHKAPRWKSSLKGLYDLRRQVADILVTGSARLDVFRKGGDSLLGRYYLLRLHPFSLGEIEGTFLTNPDSLPQKLEKPIRPRDDLMKRLLRFGGFPEPYLKADPIVWNLWKRLRLERIIREDIFDVARAHEIALLESFAALLPLRVGSLFSHQSLAEELGVSHPTIRRWLEWLSQLYYVYSLQPYSKKLARSLKKQPKIYLWDWSETPDEAARFENMVAGHLLKAAHYWTDTGRGLFELFFVRDKEKREVDFLMTRDRKPWLLAECKMTETSPSPHLLRYSSPLSPEITLQIVSTGGLQERFDLPNGKKGYLISAGAILSLF